MFRKSIMVTVCHLKHVSIAQSVERKTEDLEAACSIHARDTVSFVILLKFFSFTLFITIKDWIS